MKTCTAFLALAINFATLLAANDPPIIKASAQKPDDKVAIQGEAGKIVLAVKSPSGIGSGTVELVGEKWPDAVVVRLQLQGLENFVVANDKLKLHVSVSSADGKPRIRIWKDGKEDEAIVRPSVYWMDVRLLDANGKVAQEIPLKNGCFEIPLPRILFDGNPKNISLQWIDFYRG